MISVIVPVYKVENYINRCIDSIIGQTYTDLEILLVDDGSPDRCGEICEDYARKDSRIKVIHKKNGGLSSARNAALDVATGEYIACVDSDDYIHPRMFEKLYEAAIKYTADIVTCMHFVERDEKLFFEDPIIDDVKIYNHDTAVKAVLDDIEIRNYAWDKLYKKSLWENVRYPEGRNYEDIATTYKLFDKAEVVCKIPDVLYYYQIRTDSISGKMTTQKWYSVLPDIIQNKIERELYFEKKNDMEICKMIQAENLNNMFDFITLDVNENNGHNISFVQNYLIENKDKILNNPYVSGVLKKKYSFYIGSIRNIKKYNKLKTAGKAMKCYRYRTKEKLKELGLIKSINYSFELENGKTKRVVYFELPDFDNLGDHAISYATRKYLEGKYKDTEYQLFVVDGPNCREGYGVLRKIIKKDDIVVLQGGGNFGNLYPFADSLRMKALSIFKNNKIVIFPQTLYFTDNKEGEEVRKKYQNIISKCKDITIYARDNISFEKMKNAFDTANVIQRNDIVSTLDMRELSSEKREGILLCLRSDKESALTSDKKKYVQQLCENKRVDVQISDTVTGDYVDISKREEILTNKWKLFGKKELVVTDRLHGMIFAMITGTPCIIIGNNHHKVRETYKTFKSCENLYYIDDIEKLENSLGTILK